MPIKSKKQKSKYPTFNFLVAELKKYRKNGRTNIQLNSGFDALLAEYDRITHEDGYLSCEWEPPIEPVRRRKYADFSSRVIV